MANLKIGTFNVKGLRNDSKRRKVFQHINQKNFDVICLQETHSEVADEKIWKSQWGGKYDKGRFNEPVSRKKKRIEEKERQEALDKARLNILKHINKICGRHNDSVVNHQQNGKSQLVKEKETGVSEVPLEKVKEKVKEYGGGAEEVLEETA